MLIHFIIFIWGAANGIGGGGGALLLFGEDEIIITKWSPIPLLLFEGEEIRNTNNDKSNNNKNNTNIKNKKFRPIIIRRIKISIIIRMLILVIII